MADQEFDVELTIETTVTASDAGAAVTQVLNMKRDDLDLVCVRAETIEEEEDDSGDTGEGAEGESSAELEGEERTEESESESEESEGGPEDRSESEDADAEGDESEEQRANRLYTPRTNVLHHHRHPGRL